MVVQAGVNIVTIYIFDSGPLIDLFHHYYPTRFPSLWENFNEMIANDRISSTREVYNELADYGDDVSEWCKEMRKVFVIPDSTELAMVREIFKIEHFQTMIRINERLKGRPVADPFVIARAKCVEEGCVVTKEIYKPHSAQIPNVCNHFDVDCTDLEGFMERENWSF